MLVREVKELATRVYGVILMTKTKSLVTTSHFLYSRVLTFVLYMPPQEEDPRACFFPTRTPGDVIRGAECPNTLFILTPGHLIGKHHSTSI